MGTRVENAAHQRISACSSIEANCDLHSRRHSPQLPTSLRTHQGVQGHDKGSASKPRCWKAVDLGFHDRSAGTPLVFPDLRVQCMYFETCARDGTLPMNDASGHSHKVYDASSGLRMDTSATSPRSRSDGWMQCTTTVGSCLSILLMQTECGRPPKVLRIDCRWSRLRMRQTRCGWRPCPRRGLQSRGGRRSFSSRFISANICR